MTCADRPCAMSGLISYRMRTPYGFVMIGAIDHVDAMREAQRSTDYASESGLEIWNSQNYERVYK